MSEPTSASTPDIERRHDEWLRTGDVNALWPDVPYPARRSALACIRATVTAVLEGSLPPRLGVTDSAGARALGVAAFIAGVGPLLGWWISQRRVGASAQAREVLARHLEHGERRSALLHEQVSRIVRTMRDLEADPILLKGLHTGADFFPHPSTRPASDIDLLVHPSEHTRAAEALSRLGFVETRHTDFASRSEWRHPASPAVVQSLELDHAENPWGVDLHSTLGRSYFRGVHRSLGELPFETRRTVTILGESVRVLEQPYLTAFLALHAGYHLGELQLVRLLDVALSARLDERAGRLDWDALAELLDRTGTERFTYPGLALAEALAPGTVRADILRRGERKVSARMLRVLAALRHAELGPLPERTLDSKLAWSVGGREVLLNLADLLLPGDDALGSWVNVYSRRASALRRAVLRRWRA